MLRDMQENYTNKTFKITEVSSLSSDDHKNLLRIKLLKFWSKTIGKIMVEWQKQKTILIIIIIITEICIAPFPEMNQIKGALQ